MSTPQYIKVKGQLYRRTAAPRLVGKDPQETAQYLVYAATTLQRQVQKLSEDHPLAPTVSSCALTLSLLVQTLGKHVELLALPPGTSEYAEQFAGKDLAALDKALDQLYEQQH